MGFFSDLKEDLSQAVNELMPEEELDQAAADNVAALIDAIYVQSRTDETDAQCEAAKAAWDALTGEQILKAMSTKDDFKAELIAMAAKANEEHAHEDEEEEHEHHHHHDHDDDHDEHCCCGHHHDDDDDDEDEHEHHHHHDHDDDHDEHCCCGHHHDHDDDDEDEHEHHHHHDHDDHDEHCCCGHHHHHHDHDADEVFTSWGVETAKKFSKADIEHALTELDTGNYGMILRSKGIVDGGADGWLEFDYVPGEWEVRARGADVGGKLVVIGSKLDEKAIAALFGC